MPAAAAEPWDADSSSYAGLGNAGAARDDRTDDLVSWYHRELGIRQLSVHEMQVGPAHAAGAHCDEHLTRLRHRKRESRLAQRLPGSFEQHCAHGR
jgi:hypothetical protein